MDRLKFQRGLIALSGLALVLASSGCRDRNLRVPPPAHYTDGDLAIPEAGAYPAYPPMSSEPSAVDPYGGIGHEAPGSFDPSATQTSGVFGGADPAVGGVTAAAGYATPGDFGVPPVPGSADPMGVYATPSSPSPYAVDPYATGAVTDPYAELNASAGSPSFLSADPQAGGVPSVPGPESFPGLEGIGASLPMPDSLPEMP